MKGARCLMVRYTTGFGTLAGMLSGLLLLIAGQSVEAGHRGCHQFFHQKVVAVQAVPLYYATVSPGLVNEAIIQKAVNQAVGETIQAFRAGQLRLDGQQTLPQTAPQSILAAKCARCHSGPEAKGGHVIDGSSPIDCETFRRSMEMLAGKGAPPPAAMAAIVKQIQAEQKQGEIMDAMLNLPQTPAPPVAGGLE